MKKGWKKIELLLGQIDVSKKVQKKLQGFESEMPQMTKKGKKSRKRFFLVKFSVLEGKKRRKQHGGAAEEDYINKT